MPDQIGLVAAVSQFLADNNATIVEASNHTPQTGRFMRHEISADDLPMTVDEFRRLFSNIADRFDMHWQLTDFMKSKSCASRQ